MRRVAAIAAVVLSAAAGAWGAGFHIAEQGAKAMGMANAFVAQADDPSALFYNPAGIAYLKGSQVSLGVTVINVPETEFTGTTRLSGATVIHERARKDIFFPPNFYATKTLESMPLSFGLGVNSLFPLAKRWSSAGNFRDVVEDIAIKPINFQPTVAYRIEPVNLALAAGIDVTHATVQLRKRSFSPLPPVGAYTDLGEMDVEGTGSGVGYNWGLLWKPTKTVSVGVSYRSEVKLDLEGDAGFISTASGAQPVNTGVSADITLPDMWKFGVALKPLEQLTLEFDADRTGWSSYDKLELVFGPPLAGFNNKPPANPTPKNWKDVWAYRFGAQYAVTPALDLRAGYGFDNTPVPDRTLGPELPDADRHNVAFGLGLHDEKASFDFAYMWVHFQKRTVANSIQSGTFESDAHLFGANLTYRF